jgi:replicative DNA helicase
MSIETRIPPQAIEAEQALLGAVIVRNERFEEAADIISRGDFYHGSHACISDAIVALMESHKAVDSITLTDALRSCGKLEAIGGPAYLADLAAAVDAPSLAATYAATVREKSIRRALLSLADNIAERIHEPGAYDAGFTELFIADAEADLAKLSGAGVRSTEPAKSAVLDGVLHNLAEGVEPGIPTGFPRPDQSFGGFNRDHLTIPAARTSRGKTAFMTNVSLNAAKAGHRVAYFTLEMSADEMWQRFIGVAALVDTFRTLKFGYQVNSNAKARVEAARKHLDAMPLEVRYRPAMTPREFRLECRRLKREMGSLDFAVIDYGLMRGHRREKDEWREKAEVVRQLKLIAGELNIAVALVCQLNREVKDHERPTSANLRDTGAQRNTPALFYFCGSLRVVRMRRSWPIASLPW